MPVKLRLSRQGRKGRPFYYIVAADSRSPRDGKFLQKVGTYNPIADPAVINVDHDAALKWLLNGAQPTHTVKSILRYTGVNLKFALMKQGKSEEEVEAIYSKWVSDKEGNIEAKKQGISAAKAAAAQAAQEAEAKRREAIAAAIAAKNAPPKEEVAEEVAEEADEAIEASAEGEEATEAESGE